MATGGGHNETTGLVRPNVSGDGSAVSVDDVGALTGGLNGWKIGGRFGGLYIGTLRMHMTHGCGFGPWSIMRDLFCC